MVTWPESLRFWIGVAEILLSKPGSAGVLGCLLSLYWAPKGFGKILFSIGFGIAGAFIVAPAAAEWFGVKQGWGPYLYALIFGMYGRHFATNAVETAAKMNWVAIATKALQSGLNLLASIKKDEP